MRRLLIAAPLFLLSTTAYAGGIEVPDVGTKALGRGSAFTARADNLSAFLYNPAGLSKSKGFNVLLVGGAVNMNVEFQRGGSGGFVCFPDDPEGCDPDVPNSFRRWDPAVDPNTGDPYPVVKNKGKIGPAPMLVANWGDVGGVDGLAIAVGLQPPSAFGSATYTDDGPQRYALRGASSISLQVGLGISYSWKEKIGVGVTLLNAITSAEFHRAARGTINSEDTEDNESPDADSDFLLKVRDLWAPALSVGVLGKPIEWLELGLTFRTPINTEAEGTLTLTPSEAASESFLYGDKVTYRKADPWVVRTGIRFIHERFDFEVDYVWEGYSNASTCNFGPDVSAENGPRRACGNGFEVDFGENTGVTLPPLGDIPLVDFMVEKNYRDVHQVRVGADFEAIPKVLAVRAGSWFQTSAFPKNNSTFSVDFPVNQQVAVTTGLTWKALERKKKDPHKADNWLDINVGYSHVFQPTVVVTEGILGQRGITQPGLPLPGNVINNGRYDVSYNLFGASFEGHF